jgi:hypothetical protein
MARRVPSSEDIIHQWDVLSALDIPNEPKRSIISGGRKPLRQLKPQQQLKTAGFR